MIAHVAAVALLNEAKVLAHPSSIDNFLHRLEKEDHVAMGMTSALKLPDDCRSRGENLRRSIARRRRSSGHRRPLKAALAWERAFAAVRKIAAAADARSFALWRHCARSEALRRGNFESDHEK